MVYKYYTIGTQEVKAGERKLGEVKEKNDLIEEVVFEVVL